VISSLAKTWLVYTPSPHRRLFQGRVCFAHLYKLLLTQCISGLECIVKNLDQWYLPYGEDVWCQQVRQHIEDAQRFNAYTPLALKTFQQTLEWLKEWACSRSFGLGTELPAFTPKDRAGEFVIESLSDSTIYMAYYTVAHLLQGGQRNYSGKPNLGGSFRLQDMKPEVMTHEAWDYVFLLSKACPYPAGSPVAQGLDKMRAEFSYWYPFVRFSLYLGFSLYFAPLMRSPYLLCAGPPRFGQRLDPEPLDHVAL